jgi:hypothetical protein
MYTPGFHCGPKLVEYSANPGNVAGIPGWFRLVRQQVQDERRTAITECSRVSVDLSGGAAKIGKFDLDFR